MGSMPNGGHFRFMKIWGKMGSMPMVAILNLWKYEE